MYTHLEQWAANNAVSGEQLGVQCLAQGSHLSRGQFLPEPKFEPSTSGYKSVALSVRPRLPPEAGKTNGGGVCCFMINKKWCDPRNISNLSHSCSPRLEHLSIIFHPFYLPSEFHRSLSLLFTFHHSQTLAWLCLSFTMCSAATLTSTLTLPLSLWGTLTKPTPGRSYQTFTNMYPVQLEDRIHLIIATLSLKMPTIPAHYQLLANQTMPPFSSHQNINKGSFRNLRWRE